MNRREFCGLGLFIPLFGMNLEPEKKKPIKNEVSVGDELSYEMTFPDPDQGFVEFSKDIMLNCPMLGRIPYTILPDHKVLLNDYENHRFVIFKKYRQGGFTTFNLIYAIWKAATEWDRHIMFVTKYDREALMLGHIVKRMELGDMVRKHTNHETRFVTGSVINYQNSQASRGKAADHIFIDEAAYIDNMSDCWKCLYPMLSCGAKCVVYSTPNGTDNWFYEIYKMACAKTNEFHVSPTHYLHHPIYKTEAKRTFFKENLGLKSYLREVKAEFI